MLGSSRGGSDAAGHIVDRFFLCFLVVFLQKAVLLGVELGQRVPALALQRFPAAQLRLLPHRVVLAILERELFDDFLDVVCQVLAVVQLFSVLH